MNTENKIYWLIGLGLAGFFLLICAVTLAAIFLVNNKSSSASNYATFSSCSDLATWLNTEQPRYGYVMEDTARGAMPMFGGDGAAEASNENNDFSTTNVQVEGIDEADYIKTDGNYIYLAVGSKVRIVDVRDPINPVIVSTIQSLAPTQNLFLYGNKLITISSSIYIYDFVEELDSELVLPPTDKYRNQIISQVYDITDKESPNLVRTIKMDGSYSAARFKEGKMYLVGNYHLNTGFYQQDISAELVDKLLPKVADVQGSRSVRADDFAKMAECDQISHYGDVGRTFSLVLGVDIDSTNIEDNNSSKVLLGSLSSMYMSHNSIYLSTTIYPSYSVLPCRGLRIIMGCPPDTRTFEDIKTDIFKLGVDGIDINFNGSARVAGTVLNQFSMDEHSGYFRIATTTSGAQGALSSSVYVIDENMDVVGELTGLAPGERIYSARFMGDRIYLVTFRTVDPLFVIDASVPTEPKVLGELKIPGFSDYLHPYDKNHLLGFGHSADPETGRSEGLKIALFDVSDPKSPKEISKLAFGEAGSSSEVTSDHKALLFDREKSLLVIPATLWQEFDRRFDSSRDPEFQGFIVMKVNLADGLSERGRVSVEDIDNRYSFPSRSLYIENNLFTWDGNTIKISNLDNLSLVSKLDIK